MDFPFPRCIVSEHDPSLLQISNLFAGGPGVAYILLDLLKFKAKLQELGEENVVARYLSAPEQMHVKRFTSDKRKREWLGGRIAAKYAAAGLLARKGINLSASGLAVVTDENGRPFLAAGGNVTHLPDISISHSGDLAAGMAVDNGFCGIDIQKITDRVVKVRNRFCTADELHLIHSFFHSPLQKQSSLLTRLWSAKEVMRKVAAVAPLPGFLELELVEIAAGSADRSCPPWQFTLLWKHGDVTDNPVSEKCSVAVTLFGDYVLALTVRTVCES